MIIKKRVCPSTVTTMANRPLSLARVEARWAASANTPKTPRMVPIPLPITWASTYSSVVT